MMVFGIAAIAGQEFVDKDWWRTANMYQIAPISFKDSNDDGKGDFQGIISKIEYLNSTGINVILLSPFYSSPWVDFGYDISNYLEIDPIYGNVQKLKDLILQAKKYDIKVILDFVPNHTSNKHDWFVKSENRERGYENFYVWHDGLVVEDMVQPQAPNNWKSEYGGAAWTWSVKRQQYYYHKFASEQPDLNFRENRVVDAVDEVLTYWLSIGADGFRVDAVSQLFEDAAYRNEAESLIDLPETFELIEHWRILLIGYQIIHGGGERLLLPQVWNSPIKDIMNYYEPNITTPRAQFPFNFILINELNDKTNASGFKATIDKFINALPIGAVPSWFLGSHDHSRVASRFGPERVDGMMALLLTLPGVAVTYYGDEIGMVDYRDISWEDTTDPQACNLNPSLYKNASRDPARTPFQWDSSAFSGFTSNIGDKLWLPVHPDYEKNNLEMQMKADKSHYKFFQQLSSLRQDDVFKFGNFSSKAITDNIFAYTRNYNDKSFAVIINLERVSDAFNINELGVNFGDKSEVVLVSSVSNYEVGELVKNDLFIIEKYDVVILKARSSATIASLSLMVVLISALKNIF
ncbi:unnamed protein product [Diamesa serratosioi]